MVQKEYMYMFAIVGVVALFGVALVSTGSNVAGEAFNRGNFDMSNFNSKNFDTSWVSKMRGGMQQANWQQNFGGQNGANVMTLRNQLGEDFSPGSIRQLTQLAMSDPAAAQAEVTRLCGEAAAKYSELEGGKLEELKAQFRQRANDMEQRYEGIYNKYCVNRDFGKLQGNADFLVQDSNLGQYEEQLDQMCAQARDNAASLKSQFSDESVNVMIDSYKKKYQDLKSQWCDNPNAVNDFINQMMGRMSSRSSNSRSSGRSSNNRFSTGRMGNKETNPSIQCYAVYDPVCGTDGKTYSNSCYAMKAGVSVSYDGECGSQQTPGNNQIPDDSYIRPPSNSVN